MNYPINRSAALLRLPFFNGAKAKQPGFLGNVLVWMLPILGLLKIELGGELFVHEMILILLFPMLLIRRGYMLKQSMVKIILLFGLMWLGSQMLTDFIRDIPSEDYMRGWAKISFFLISFASLVMLLMTPYRVYLWAAASVIPLFFRPFQLFAQDLDPLVLWKFGVGAALLMTLCLPSLWKVFRNPSDMTPVRRIAWIHIIFGFGSFFLNARSLAGLSIATGMLLFVFIRYRGSIVSASSMAKGLAGAIIGAFALLLIYSYGASSGIFGEEAQLKYEMQNSYGGGPLSVLLGGRSESLVSTQAIADSPIIGHGSWAKDMRYTWMLIDLKREFSDATMSDVYQFDGLIPSHSYFFGAWVEAGLLGGVFWLCVFLLCIFRVGPAAFEAVAPIGILALIILPLFLWNILFSPFGANVRVEAAGVLTIFCGVAALNSALHQRYLGSKK